MKPLVLLLSFVFALFGAEECRYEPGSGWRPTSYPVYLGGYFSLWGAADEKNRTVSIDEFALMLYGDFERWRFMSEAEVEEPYTRYFGNRNDEETHFRMRLERLFVAYDVDDYSEVTVGKFFSDIGFWNMMPINVLRDTTSDPYLVETMFPMLTTGVEYHRFKEPFGVTFALQANDDFEEAVNNFSVDRHLSVSLTYESEGVWRLAGGWYREADGKESWYAAGAYRYDTAFWTLMTEAAIRKRDDTGKLSHAFYVQGVWHLKPGHDAILRAEEWDDVLGSSEYSPNRETAIVLGYTFRPRPWIALKGEFDGYARDTERLLLSLSLLF